jgi:hypothetical protein
LSVSSLNQRRCRFRCTPASPGPRNIPAIETFKPMTLDYTKAAARVEDVTGWLAGILGL